jgi:hypothetical protein
MFRCFSSIVPKVHVMSFIANYTAYLSSYMQSEGLARLRGSLFNPSVHDDLSILTMYRSKIWMTLTLR